MTVPGYITNEAGSLHFEAVTKFGTWTIDPLPSDHRRWKVTGPNGQSVEVEFLDEAVRIVDLGVTVAREANRRRALGLDPVAR